MAPSDDVLGRLRGTYLQMSSPDTYSRKVTELVRHFHTGDPASPSRLGQQLPHQQFQPLHIRRRDSRESHQSRDQGQGRPMLRRTSEAALFPPIHAGRSEISTPVQGAGLATARSSSSTPLAQRDHAHKDHAHKDHAHKDHAPDDPTTPTPRREPSTHRPRLQGVSADVTRTVGERRAKTEQSRRGSRHTAGDGIPRLALRTEPPKTDRPAARKPAPRAQVKGREGKEQFSIRRKIEQYRRWHEEQYLDKLKKLKQEVDQKFDDNRKLSTELQGVVEIDLQRIFQENGFDPSVLADVTEQEGLGGQGGVVGAEVVAVGEGLGDRPSARGLLVSRDSLLTAKQRSARELKRLLGNRGGRTTTAQTWRTWRDVNDSDAYSDVHKYIRDNELMTPEKETWIREWICEVERACAPTEAPPPSISHISAVSDSDSVFG